MRSQIPAFWCLQRGDSTHQGASDLDPALCDQERPEELDLLYCAQCGAPITSRRFRMLVNEQHEHVFANPAGYIFRIGCFSAANGCMMAGEETEFFTWFPGYAWRYALCGNCIELLGWAFRSPEALFFGLIVEKLRE